MRRHGVEQQGDGGAAQLAQPGDIASPARAHFHYRVLNARLECEQGQGHADFIVEVALGGEGPAPSCQYGAHHVFGRGLAATAGDGHQRPGEKGAVVGAQAPQRPLRVCDPQVGERQLASTTDQRRHRAARGRLAEEFMAVKMLALQGYEQLAAGERATVGCDRAEFTVRSDQPRLQRRYQLCQGQRAHHDAAFRARAASACSSSLK